MTACPVNAQLADREPVDCLRLLIDERAVGWLLPAHQALLMRLRPESVQVQGEVFHLHTGAGPGGAHEARSVWMQALAQELHEMGAVLGWRGEAYRCERSPQPVGAAGDLAGDLAVGVDVGAPFFDMERAAFRFFGLRSRAVHVNGWWPDRTVCCGRRALHKATDPGRLDNLAAGGLTAGEDPSHCVRRELWEEAGVPQSVSSAVRFSGVLRTQRMEAEGWHDEVLHVYDLALPMGFQPCNQDGEVSGFERLTAADCRDRIDAHDFSPDAAAVTLLWLSRQGP